MIPGQKCTRKWTDQFGIKWKCTALATEIVNGKHLCKHHANNTLRRQRIKERIKNGTYGANNLK